MGWRTFIIVVANHDDARRIEQWAVESRTLFIVGYGKLKRGVEVAYPETAVFGKENDLTIIAETSEGSGMLQEAMRQGQVPVQNAVILDNIGRHEVQFVGRGVRVNELEDVKRDEFYRLLRASVN